LRGNGSLAGIAVAVNTVGLESGQGFGAGSGDLVDECVAAFVVDLQDGLAEFDGDYLAGVRLPDWHALPHDSSRAKQTRGRERYPSTGAGVLPIKRTRTTGCRLVGDNFLYVFEPRPGWGRGRAARPVRQARPPSRQASQEDAHLRTAGSSAATWGAGKSGWFIPTGRRSSSCGRPASTPGRPSEIAPAVRHSAGGSVCDHTGTGD
jgi:hypothetical protein